MTVGENRHRLSPDSQRILADAVNYHQAGHLAEAERRYRQVLEVDSRHPDALHLMGVLANQVGRCDVAVDLIGRAIALDGNQAAYHSNLGLALHDLGRFDESVAACHAALRLKRDHTEALSNLGNALKNLGRLSEALIVYKTALSLKPDFAEAYSNRGNGLQDLERPREAVAAYRTALRLKPDYAEAHCNLGNVLKDLGRLSEAVAACRSALCIRPDYPDALYNLGNALHDLGRSNAAAYGAALRLKPDFAQAYSNLAVALRDLGRVTEAVATFRAALGLKPDFAEAYSNLGSVLKDLGRAEDALAVFAIALHLRPNYTDAYSNLLFCLSGYSKIGSHDLFVRHREFSERFEAPLSEAAKVFSNARDLGRPLRVGLVSGDFRDHPVGQFLEPVLYNLRNDARLSLHAYSNSLYEDATTGRLKKYFASWTLCVGLRDADLTAAIRADAIDILLDLSGHTAKNRLLTFARRAAPVQASWLGYVGTTGLNAMDYYLADRYFVPNATVAAQFTEKIVYLSSIAVFSPPADAPPINPLPALTRGSLTFASFNNLRKINRACVAIWSQLLRAAPSARMMVAGLPVSGAAPIIDWLEDEGIAADRLILQRKCSWSDFLALHHEVDIALDSFPCGGGMTTNIGLWMGVPTLTLRGQTPAGGIAAAYLTNVGLTDYVASSPTDFVAQGQRLASDLDQLGRLRATLRQRVTASDLGDAAGIADSLRRALRAMWVRWCSGEPPADIIADRRG